MLVLLTGATGFIGSHVARELLGRGHEVHITTRLTSDLFRLRDIEEGFHIHHGEMDSVPLNPEVLIHLAWHVPPGTYLTSPENRVCLEASRRLLGKVDARVVGIGTCFEFDTRLGVLTENSPTLPLTPYAQCKHDLGREVMERADSVWARLFYQYGPWEDARRKIPSAICSLLDGKMLTVKDCGEKRDYLHVEDVARAICTVAESSLTGAVNIGSGAAVSVKWLMEQLGTATDREGLIKRDGLEEALSGPVLVQADNSKLKSAGWTPKWTLERGLSQTVNWWKEQRGLKS